MTAVGCECGEWSGVPCDWRGPMTETVVVEWMPRCWRASHRTAGNVGRYPDNGALRSRVAAKHGKAIVDADGEWARILAP